VTIECPRCQTSNTRTAETLWSGRQLPCFQCHTALTVDVHQLNTALAQVATAAHALMHRITERRDGATRVLIAH
jgi:hypothetical protein